MRSEGVREVWIGIKLLKYIFAKSVLSILQENVGVGLTILAKKHI